MQHYFLKEIKDDKAIFMDEDIHHILHVMRFNNLDKVIGIYNSNKYLLSLDISKDIVAGNIINKLESKNTNLHVTLIHGLPKNDKFELAIQKSCEIGVSKIVPFISDRSIIKISIEDFSKKLTRYNKIIKEACEQSERNELVEITNPIYLKDIIKYKSSLNIICDETYGRNNSSNLLDILQTNSSLDITFVVGPEGGFSKEELEFFNKNDFISVGLGNNILRSETAVIYFLSCLSMVRK